MSLANLSTAREALGTAGSYRLRTRSRACIVLALLCSWLLLAVPSDGYLGEDRIQPAITRAIAGQGFRLAAWEQQAIAQKLSDFVTRPGSELSHQEQRELVESYFQAVSRIAELGEDIAVVFADPKLEDPSTAAQPLLAELETLRREQSARRATAERILEQQVSAGLAEAGLSSAGVVWPPVRFQFTESPNYLIISPRARIEVRHGVYLDPVMPAAEMQRIESQLEERFGVSALVEGTGGFSSYPTMVLETPSLAWTLDTIAHEWAHTYLIFRPLGWAYYSSGDMRTINETVASIIGEEVALRVMFRFYPETVRPVAWPRPFSMLPDWHSSGASSSVFDYGAFMRGTRLKVDRLLEEGNIDEAETYMEARRQVLVERGYPIRRLNQAYFAFHGSYAVGSTATDPIGGKLMVLRRRSGSLADFLHTVSRFNEASDLDRALQGSPAAAAEAPCANGWN